MKRSFLLPTAPCIAVLVALATAGTASAYGHQTIVNSQVVSDTAAPTGSYVGDLSPQEAGVPCNSCHGGGAGYERQYGQPDLFYNYYTQGYSNRANAQLYLSPQPIPPNVGHTFYTYQPLYPHHYMFPHKDRYHNYYDGGRGTNRTKVTYRPSARQIFTDFYWNFIRLPR